MEGPELEAYGGALTEHTPVATILEQVYFLPHNDSQASPGKELIHSSASLIVLSPRGHLQISQLW